MFGWRGIWHRAPRARSSSVNWCHLGYNARREVDFADPTLAGQRSGLKLAATIEAFNAAADWLASEAFKLQSANKVKLRQLYSRRLREDFSLSAPTAIRRIAQACEASSRDHSKRPRFKKYASIPADPRSMSFKGLDRVSRLTLEGRMVVPVGMGASPPARFDFKRGQSDRVRRKTAQGFCW